MLTFNTTNLISQSCSRSQRQSSRWSCSRATKNSDVMQFKSSVGIYH